MAIIFKNPITPREVVQQEPQKHTSFADLKKTIAPPSPAPVAETRQIATAPKKIEQSNQDSNLIKPKYTKDKSIFYKSSGYLKDLLGEGN